jgi:hypothetical protein
MSSVTIIIYFAAISGSLILGGVCFNRLSAPMKILVFLLLATLISESFGIYLSYARRNNFQVYHFYVIVSFWLYSLIYYSLLNKMGSPFILLALPILFTIFSLINSLTYEKLDNFPSINIMASNVMLVIYSLLYYKHLIDLDPFKPLRKNSLFWFNSAVLIYFTIQIFIWGMLNYLIKNKKDISILISFGSYISISYYITLGISIWINHKQERLKAK